MIAFHKATLVASLLALVSVTVHAARPPLPQQIEQAARAELERQAAESGLSEPQIDVAVVAARAAPACEQDVAIEALDMQSTRRSAQRMRFLARCNDKPGWRLEYVVRGRLSAMVAVAAAPVAANEALTDAQVMLERRDISSIADPVTQPEIAVGQMSRRMLRPGDILRSSQLLSPVLVKRGDAVVMTAHRDGIEVSTAGEALDAGAQGALVRVRNANSGQVVRMRVAGPGLVEPVDMALTR
jgi:flagella basal body P-ring formation protein FlgA